MGSLDGSTWGLDSTHGYAQRGKHREAMATSCVEYFGTGGGDLYRIIALYCSGCSTKDEIDETKRWNNRAYRRT